MNKYELLKKYYGHTEFRPGQAQLIDAIMGGRDTLGIMPTGAGKSICYQIPAMLLDGITLVISPLISLMKDQVAALVQAGVRAAFLNSSLSMRQQDEFFARAARGEYKIIYVAPERLETERFAGFASGVQISMLAVDEAHCVSQWGQDFRPNYLKIAEFCRSLPKRPVVCAFTATATDEVRRDIVRLLELKNPFETVTGFDRPNLSFDVITAGSDKYNYLLRVVTRNRGRSGIVYCSTRKLVEEVCEKLCAEGFSATRYHAGLEQSERHANQEDFIFERRDIMVATNAFGMGIDKSNVSYVVHYNMPKSIEAYYQEAGRAGRDGEPAECVLLYGAQDVRTNLFLIDQNENDSLDPIMLEKVKEKDRERLQDMIRYCSHTGCLRAFILRYFGEKTDDHCGNCGQCNSDYVLTDITVDAQKIVSCVWRMEQMTNGLCFGRAMIAAVLHGSGDKRIREYGFDKLSTWGIMADTPVPRIQLMIDYLVECGFLRDADIAHRTVGISEKSSQIVKDRVSVSMRLPVQKKPEKKVPSLTGTMDGQGKQMLGALRDVRSQIAAREHTPAYIIFSNASLQDMCRRKPLTMEEFLEVSGVGEKKAEKYWNDFAPVIARYAGEKDKK